MKIRIRGNSVRFRLTKPDVEMLCAQGWVEETTAFPDRDFHYRVEISDQTVQLSGSYVEDRITIYLPRGKAEGWAINNLVGFEYYLQLNSGEQLFLLLEKDFTCLTERGEDESENYPNPNELN